MSLRKIGVFILSFVSLFSACNNNDDDDGTAVFQTRDRAEQQIEDDSLLLDYLGRHYYNSSYFENNPDARISDLDITKLETGVTEAPDGYTILGDLLNQPNSILQKKEVVFRETDYKYYILKLRQGGGEGSPRFTDDIRVLYEGFLLDGQVFDTNLEVPTTFELVGPTGIPGVIQGWLNVFPNFNVADDLDINSINPDGTVDYTNPGMGMMFLPSGLAYFSEVRGIISEYSPLVFKFELLQYFEKDHDNDGVPSYLEVGVNPNNNLIDTYEKLIAIDTDGNLTPNFLDNDDDGDGILTINEDLNKDGDPTNDIGANGISNYLDIEETRSKEDI